MYGSLAKAMSVLLIISACACSAAQSHSGGTDANGWHTNSKTGKRHQHPKKQNASSASSRSSSSGDSPLPAAAFSLDLKGASGLSDEDYESNKDCKKFAFSEILRQSDGRYLRLRCGQVVMSIEAK